MRFRTAESFILLSVAAALATGCGDKYPGLVPVSGVVTIDGKPLAHGGVTVQPQGQRPSMARLDEQGRFTLTYREPGDGVLTGTHLTTVAAVEQLSETSQRWHAPKEYANPATSGLWVTIDGPTDDLKIELSWDKSAKEKGPFVEKF